MDISYFSSRVSNKELRENKMSSAKTSTKVDFRYVLSLVALVSINLIVTFGGTFFLESCKHSGVLKHVDVVAKFAMSKEKCQI
jgi:hypothetical protein